MSIILVTLLAGCGLSGSKERLTSTDELSGSSIPAASVRDESTAASENTVVSENTTSNMQGSTAQNDITAGNANQGGANEQLLQSASVDLNGDGENEQVEVVQITVSEDPDGAKEIEGRLKIRSGSSEKQLTFCRKNAGMSGVLTNIQFEDLDKDGAKDIFIIIPDNGASFSYFNYFIFSYKKNSSYSFTSDNELADFISGFSFKHTGGNILNLSNSKYAFTSDLVIEYDLDQRTPDEYMLDYEQRAWIDPVSVDISENSKLALTKTANGSQEIKMPLPVFGLATVDMIGEIDLYYTVDNTFNPVLKRFEVLDFNGTEQVKVGSCEISK